MLLPTNLFPQDGDGLVSTTPFVYRPGWLTHSLTQRNHDL